MIFVIHIWNSILSISSIFHLFARFRSARPLIHTKFVANHPFLFLIYDKQVIIIIIRIIIIRMMTYGYPSGWQWRLWQLEMSRLTRSCSLESTNTPPPPDLSLSLSVPVLWNKDNIYMRQQQCLVFIGPRCPWFDLCVRLSVTNWCFVDLTDVTLADEVTNSILTDNANRAIQGNVRKSYLVRKSYPVRKVI